MEMASTRRLLERVPGEKGTWKPHQRSFALRHLAQLVSRMPGWITRSPQACTWSETQRCPVFPGRDDHEPPERLRLWTEEALRIPRHGEPCAAWECFSCRLCRELRYLRVQHPDCESKHLTAY